jgi:hypothetical protein
VRLHPGVAVGLLLGLLLKGGALGQSANPPAAAPGLAEHLAALKQALAQSRNTLHGYQWVETRAVSYKGEVKSTTKSQCSYGPDGTMQRVQLSVNPPEESKGGGGIAERKRQEMRNTVKAALALVRSYLPLDPTLIQKCKDAGKASLNVLAAGKLIRLVFRDYKLPGDILTLTLDAATNKLTQLTVSSYLDASTPVSVDVRMSSLADGTSYAEDIQLAIQSKEVTVGISNSDYKPKS